ncbi:MAG: type II toxin-antitoxin system MqsA family antitoxin, partial [Gemmatimonadota bacterium]
GTEDLREGQVTLTFERAGKTIVVKGVPGYICPNCGEEYVSDEIAAHALEAAEQAAGGDDEVAVVHYKAA